MAISGDPFDESVHDFEADLLVGFLPALKPQLKPHFMIVTKELDSVIALGLQVVGVNGRRELDLLHPARRLRSAGILGALSLLIKELAVVHDPANRRCGRRRDLDQVESLPLRQPQRVIERHDPELLFVLVKHPHLAGADLAIAAMKRFPGAE